MCVLDDDELNVRSGFGALGSSFDTPGLCLSVESCSTFCLGPLARRPTWSRRWLDLPVAFPVSLERR